MVSQKASTAAANPAAATAGIIARRRDRDSARGPPSSRRARYARREGSARSSRRALRPDAARAQHLRFVGNRRLAADFTSTGDASASSASSRAGRRRRDRPRSPPASPRRSKRRRRRVRFPHSSRRRCASRTRRRASPANTRMGGSMRARRQQTAAAPIVSAALRRAASAAGPAWTIRPPRAATMPSPISHGPAAAIGASRARVQTRSHCVWGGPIRLGPVRQHGMERHGGFGSQALLPTGWATGVRAARRRQQHRVGRNRRRACARRRPPRPCLPASPRSQPRLPARHGGALREAAVRADDDFLDPAARRCIADVLTLDPDRSRRSPRLPSAEMAEAGSPRSASSTIPPRPGRRALCESVPNSLNVIAAAVASAGIGPLRCCRSSTHGTSAARPQAPARRASLNTPDGYAALLIVAARRSRRLKTPGSASLRTAARRDATRSAPSRALAGRPHPIHAAEQTREVEDCLAHFGARPVDVLLDRIGLDARWCLVHATHLTDRNETPGAKQRDGGALPVTESNLGDGVFSGPRLSPPAAASASSAPIPTSSSRRRTS